MRLLIAEDEPMLAGLLQECLQLWGHEAAVVPNGKAAWEILQGETPPPLAILDWMMPGLDGVDVCRLVRQRYPRSSIYLILLTSRANKEDVVQGLAAGADDYITKPCDLNELRARVQVGVRVVKLQRERDHQLRELQEALSHVKRLQGILPICSYCKKIRDDSDYWQQVESYIADHSEVQFSHGICPECLEKHLQGELGSLERRHLARPAVT